MRRRQRSRAAEVQVAHSSSADHLEAAEPIQKIKRKSSHRHFHHVFCTYTLFLVVLLLSPSLPTTYANHIDFQIDDEFRGNFEEELVVKIKNPTDVQISPDGSLMMVPDKNGALYVVTNFEGYNPKTTVALEFNKICTNVERGFSGCAFHPNFGSGNRYIYTYYTYDKNDDCDVSGSPNRGPVNRLSRFVLDEDLKVDKSTEEVFFDTPIMPYGAHNSGNIAFGQDGYLYVSVGDGGGGISTTNDADVLYPQALDMLLGKILRLTEDGDIPPTNPYVNDKSERCNKSGWTSKPSIKCQEIFSYGLRNPWRFAMDVNNKKKTKFYINDVGRHTWESIKEAGDGLEGANYGTCSDYPFLRGRVLSWHNPLILYLISFLSIPSSIIPSLPYPTISNPTTKDIPNARDRARRRRQRDASHLTKTWASPSPFIGSFTMTRTEVLSRGPPFTRMMPVGTPRSKTPTSTPIIPWAVSIVWWKVARDVHIPHVILPSLRMPKT